MNERLRWVTTIAEVRNLVSEAKNKGKYVGLVPTMGALHRGHEELIRRASQLSDFVVVSIFVNPTQFGPLEDLAKYPRTPEDDGRLCESGGAALVFAPTVDEMYPGGSSAGTIVDVPEFATKLEGASRPGHFRGVATVVMKLFQIVQPDIAVFGQKDFQQLAVIRRMVTDLNLPVQIDGLPTVREPDGLAMSSRNRYLGPEDRAAAVVLHRSLMDAVAAVRAGERSADRVRQILRSGIESERRANLDYAEVVDAETLEPVTTLDAGRLTVALVAARVGPARLIDNALLSE